MSSFPIFPRAGGDTRREPPTAIPKLPILNLGKISFASMGGSSEVLHFPENDFGYDIQHSSDEDLDGMEAAVGLFEARNARRDAAADAYTKTLEANERERVAREKSETQKSLRTLRARRTKFELAAAVTPTRSSRGVSRARPEYEQSSDDLQKETEDSEAKQSETLRERRKRVDQRIAALLGEERTSEASFGTAFGDKAVPEFSKQHSPSMNNYSLSHDSCDAVAIAHATLASAQVAKTYVPPKWKQRWDVRELTENGNGLFAEETRANEHLGGVRVRTNDAAIAASSALRLHPPGGSNSMAKAVSAIQINDSQTLHELLSTQQLRSAQLDTIDELSGVTLLTLASSKGNQKAV
jgi:hypothetical protein